MKSFFTSLSRCLKRGGKAVLQFYPPEGSVDHVSRLTEAAMNCGFTASVIVDYPNSARAKKYYLMLLNTQIREEKGAKAKTGFQNHSNRNKGFSKAWKSKVYHY